jgi:hypothetical protein
MTLKFAGAVVSANVLVSDCFPRPIMVGMDFVRATGLSVSANCLKFGGHKKLTEPVKFESAEVLMQSKTRAETKVVAAKRYIIPSKTVKSILVEMVAARDDMAVLLEPLERPTQSGVSLIAGVVASDCGLGSALYANGTDFPIVVEAGEVVGRSSVLKQAGIRVRPVKDPLAKPSSVAEREAFAMDGSKPIRLAPANHRDLDLDSAYHAPQMDTDEALKWPADWSEFFGAMEPDEKKYLAEFNLKAAAELLTVKDLVRLKKLLVRYRGAFSPAGVKLRGSDRYQHHIRVKDGTRPIAMAPYKASPAEKAAIEKEIVKMRSMGVIRPSSSPWAAPVVLVLKKDGGIRFCVDYRRLNACTELDSYPVTRQDDCLEAVVGACIFSLGDCLTGFWQLFLDPSSIALTAFTTHQGLWEFTRMPFGLVNAPASFSRLMDSILAGLKYHGVLVYIDDLLVYSKTVEEHFQLLEEVLGRLVAAGIRLKPSKCQFCVSKVVFLGHCISTEGLEPEADKVEAVRQFAAPTNVKGVRSFIGMASYYRKFIPHFAHIAEPLIELTRKKRVFRWNTACQEAFDQLKSSLSSAPVLAHPDPDRDFFLATDASDYAIGAVLFQRDGTGNERPVRFLSKTLSSSERVWGVPDREAYALVYAIEKCRGHLIGRQFTVYTDHNNLKYIMHHCRENMRLARWALRIQQFLFTIKFIKGADNICADALSRIQRLDDASEMLVVDCGAIKHVLSVVEDGSEAIDPGVISSSYRDFGLKQREDVPLRVIMEYIQFGKLPTEAVERRRVTEARSDHVMEQGALWHVAVAKNKEPQWQLVVPGSLRTTMMKLAHDIPISGHQGVTKTVKRLLAKYWWKGMRADVREYVTSCEQCIRYKPNCSHRHGLLHPIHCQ